MTRPLSLEEAQQLVRSAVGAKVADRDLSADASLEGLGLTSLDLAEVLFAVERHLGMELEPVASRDPVTVGELLDQVNATIARAAGAGRA